MKIPNCFILIVAILLSNLAQATALCSKGDIHKAFSMKIIRSGTLFDQLDEIYKDHAGSCFGDICRHLIDSETPQVFQVREVFSQENTDYEYVNTTKKVNGLLQKALRKKIYMLMSTPIHIGSMEIDSEKHKGTYNMTVNHAVVIAEDQRKLGRGLGSEIELTHGSEQQDVCMMFVSSHIIMNYDLDEDVNQIVDSRGGARETDFITELMGSYTFFYNRKTQQFDAYIQPLGLIEFGIPSEEENNPVIKQ